MAEIAIKAATAAIGGDVTGIDLSKPLDAGTVAALKVPGAVVLDCR